jgi:hypothetical protein
LFFCERLNNKLYLCKRLNRGIGVGYKILDGATGGGDDEKKDSNKDPKETAKIVAEAVAADAASAGNGMLVVAFLGPATPMGLLGVAISAAAGSGYTALVAVAKK